jgi:flagellar basal-body rod protein FlgF
MDRLLYIATVGARHIDRAQQLAANNLANVSTTGFRADLARAESRWVEGDGHPARVYGVSQTEHVDMSLGVKQQTGRPLDVAVAGEGLIALQNPDGSEAYTRNGQLRVDAFGRLLGENDLPVLGEGGPISLPPFTSVQIGRDGTISIRPEGQAPNTLVEVDRIKLVNPAPGDVLKNSSGNLVRADGEAEARASGVELESGYLESSNVNAVHELTSILSLARQFELEVRMMQTAKDNDEAAARLMQVS